MASVKEMNQKLKDFVEAGKVISDYFGQERMSVQMFKEEVGHLLRQKEDLLKHNAEIEARNEELKQQGQTIIAEKQKEADQIISIARENLVAASRDRAQAKQELEAAEKKAYMAGRPKEDLVAL